jgi:hypothetical protein
VVHQLRDRPLDRPQRRLDRCRGTQHRGSEQASELWCLQLRIVCSWASDGAT